MKVKVIRFAALAILLWSVILLYSTFAATSHYIRAGASGSGTGADWTNACTGFTGSCAASSLVRGDTYFVATGSYSGATFSVAASGSTLITIQGATAAAHGTDTGWSNSFGVDVTQATFTSSITFNTSNWVFDGSVGPVWDRTAADYGFAFASMTKPMFAFSLSSAITNFTFAHIAATAPSGDVEKFFLSTDNSTKAVTNVTITNSYLNGWQNAYWATSPGLTMDSWLFQYNMCLNGFSSTAHHGEWINNNFGLMTNQVTRFNWFDGQQNGTGVIVANNNNNQAPQVYGNVFNNVAEGNGLITGTSAGNMISPQVYNNTFVSSSASGGWIGTNITGTAVIRNNLLYNMSAAASQTGDYNAYFKTTNTPSETHGQTSTANPFVNSAALNYQLIAETSPGLVLAAPFNVDVLGNARPGADGIWSRGAYQFATAGSIASISPTSIAFANQVIATTSAAQTITLTNTGSATLTSTGAAIAGTNATDFAISANTCGSTTVGIGANCIVSVTFTPLAATARSATLSFTNSASNSPQTIPLSGTGVNVIPPPAPHKPVIGGLLPPGVVGVGYSAGLIASADTPPLRWSANPTMPGLTLNSATGVLSGTPTAAAVTSLSFQVVDSYICGPSDPAGCTNTSAAYPTSLIIAAVPPPPNPLSALWPTTTVPANSVGNDDASVELGVTFSSSVAASVVGIRFYKARNSTGVHTGTLWSAAGKKLATGTFSGESVSGWQMLTFATPISITAGTTYIASYHTTQYAWNSSYRWPIASTPLTTAAKNAGVYAYGSTSAFPKLNYQSSNYWVTPVVATGVAQ